MQDIITGLQILLKYGEDAVCAEHDIIYAGHDCRDAMSNEDKEAMEKAGWFWNEESDSYSTFT